MMKIQIREATLKDKPALKNFQKSMAIETEGLELNEDILDKGLETVINDPSKGRYFVAESENEAIGCLMITPEWSDWRNGTVWWIQSVYINIDWRRKGVYRKLYEYIKDWVKSDENYKGIRLYVEKENVIAQQVYSNLGMDGEHYKMYEWMKG